MVRYFAVTFLETEAEALTNKIQLIRAFLIERGVKFCSIGDDPTTVANLNRSIPPRIPER